jgi:hypothetical protein
MSAGLWGDLRVWLKQWLCDHPKWREVQTECRAIGGDKYIKRTCRECGKEWL